MPDVVMAVNPITQKMVNVLPLFQLTKEFDFESIEQELDNTIRLLICSLSNDTLEEFSNQIKTSCYAMYHLRDMFKEISKCEISLPKK